MHSSAALSVALCVFVPCACQHHQLIDKIRKSFTQLFAVAHLIWSKHSFVHTFLVATGHTCRKKMDHTQSATEFLRYSHCTCVAVQWVLMSWFVCNKWINNAPALFASFDAICTQSLLQSINFSSIQQVGKQPFTWLFALLLVNKHPCLLSLCISTLLTLMNSITFALETKLIFFCPLTRCIKLVWTTSLLAGWSLCAKVVVCTNMPCEVFIFLFARHPVQRELGPSLDGNSNACLMGYECVFHPS